ncbi:hypothetical protein [Streptomyces sp. TRM68367]|uniref:hypothetical protein n=1 Tax=Streptomyces sp. TRM68367 TaxID=2758415 RepID=UPI00165B814F|nr:hypothetical protein [Streptomyces sp. TRM68367]MBC9728574.1 hypothetical protein [Streptomyces sp. TRM68367]
MVEVRQRSDIPGLLLDVVPESRTAVEEMLRTPAVKILSEGPPWYDLYNFLKEVLWHGVMLPEFRSDSPNKELLRRCFTFVEVLISSPVQSISDAGYFQAIEPLFADEELVLISFPLMGEKTLSVAQETLDPERISPAARETLAPFLP